MGFGRAPYNITTTVQVAEGVTLTIEPGVTIKDDNDSLYDFEVWGTLETIGSQTEHIEIMEMH